MNDQQAADAIRAHHEEMQGELRSRVDTLLAAVRGGESHAAAHDLVRAYLEGELLPHAAAEERTLYAAGDTGRTELLVRSMRQEHTFLVARVDAFSAKADAVTLATMASAILALFEVHLWKENEMLIPALVADPDIRVAELLEGMHELVG